MENLVIENLVIESLVIESLTMKKCGAQRRPSAKYILRSQRCGRWEGRQRDGDENLRIRESSA